MLEVTISVWEATKQELNKQLTRYLATIPSDWIQVHHSDIPGTDDSQSSSNLWPQDQYQTAFEIVFCQTPSQIINSLHHSIQQDDLQFFVCLDPPSSSSHRFPSNKVFPRRRASLLLPSLGDVPLNIIDWRATCLLNIILLTNYTLSVVKCKQEDLPTLLHNLEQQGGRRESSSSSSSSSPGLVSVTKQVFPTPSKSTVNLDNSRNKDTLQPALIYPEIAFSVDDFHHAFSSIVLSNPDDCYCLVAHAHIGPFSSSSSSGGKAVKVEDGEAAIAIDLSNDNSSKELLFSGFVSHSQLEAVVGPPLRDPFRKVPIIGEGDTRKVVMKGPGAGEGFAEVAVSADSEDDGGADGGGVGGVVKMIAKAAKLITEDNKVGLDMKLRCAVMTLIIDVETIGLKLLGGENGKRLGEREASV